MTVRLPTRASLGTRMIVTVSALAVVAAANLGAVPAAQESMRLEARIRDIVERPEFRHARFGIAIESLDSGKLVYQLAPDALFTPASTTKLVSVGAALHLLGSDYRFHTPVYRTGPILDDGVLDGDLVLVASGDPNLSGRIGAGGTLAFEDHDHAYGGPPVDGDPLLVIRELARQVADAGIRRINGAVRVDVGLFAEGDRELGTGVVLSPIAVNDNVIDVALLPADEESAPARLSRAPVTSWVRFRNRVVTVAGEGEAEVEIVADEALPGGGRRVTLVGTIPLEADPARVVYRVPGPGRYAAALLGEVLAAAGIRSLETGIVDQDAAPTVFYRPDMLVAEHVSPPFRQEAKVTLKVSQNLHASMIPLYLAPLLSPGNPDRTGFDHIRDMLAGAGLDLDGARMADGAGGDAHFSPAFMVRYLTWMTEQEEFPDFFAALPVLGVDGTLADIQVDSPAAGHVHAKTGTFVIPDPLNRRWLLTAKGLAGYVDRVDGERLVFAAYLNDMPLDDIRDIGPVAGETLGEIAAAAYDSDY